MLKNKIKKVKETAKKYHMDYLAIAAGGIAVGALAYKLHLDITNRASRESGIGIEPFLIDGKTPGIACNVYDFMKNGEAVWKERLIFDREKFLEFDELALKCLEEALQKKAENE